MARAPLILASESPRRAALLKQIGASPDRIIPANIDETPLRNEAPRAYVARVAAAKADAVASANADAFVLAADTAVACGRRILPKAETQAEARACLSLISGRAHRVYSAVALCAPNTAPTMRIVETRVKIRRLDPSAIDNYLQTEEWRGKAGGYAIQGDFAKHVVSIIGAHANVVGLPVYEVWNLLTGAGWRP